jgi:quercetin dioxygenase-like cupin family protein
LFIKGEEKVRLKTGDMFSTPPDIPHTIQLLTSTARLVDSFYPLREDFLK